MKTKSVVIVFFCLFVVSKSFAQQELFDKLVSKQEITYVSVDKKMLELMPEMSGLSISRGETSLMTSKIDQIDIFASEETSGVVFIKKEIEKYFKDNEAYNVLMTLKDDDENVVIYTREENDLFKHLVIFVSEGDEASLVWIQGSFTKEDIQSIKEIQSTTVSE